ncbi:unnamed protein product, partial [Prorocentrum cordatum]
VPTDMHLDLGRLKDWSLGELAGPGAEGQLSSSLTWERHGDSCFKPSLDPAAK